MNTKRTLFALVGLVIFLLLLFLYVLPSRDEPQDSLKFAQQFCDDETTALVERSLSSDYVKVTSILLGGGATYYETPDSEGVQCPVVGPDSMSEICKTLITITDWDVVCTGTQLTPTAEEAETVGFNFILDFIASAPPETDPEAVARAVDALSLRAQSLVGSETAPSDLAQFVKVQDVPDMGASVEDLQLFGDSATLVIGLQYSGGVTYRNINLLIENDMWKVDSVSIPEQTNKTFEATGTMVKDSPGLTPNTWFLIYEEPGKPAVTKELQFSSASICAKGQENSTCDPASFTSGTRVKVLGNEIENDTVEVIRVEFIL